MPLLADYALTPDVFDQTSYSSEEVCALHLLSIKDPLLTEGLVRDMRHGDWGRLFTDPGRTWHPRGKELVKKLATQGRLITFAPTRVAAPTQDHEWCTEALATHQGLPLTGGIIVTDPVKGAFPGEPLVAPIDRLASTPWWIARSPSTRLRRTIADYSAHLAPILRCANSIMFIDPHLDPARPGYRDFGQLLILAGQRMPTPVVEIHRVCYEGSGRARTLLDLAELEISFRRELDGPVRAASLRVDVFVWDDFHDRYVISNLLGISVPNGFDTTADSQNMTTWTRLGRSDSDDVQREFDPASGRHTLRSRFSIP